jgi:hypothetical protein
MARSQTHGGHAHTIPKLERLLIGFTALLPPNAVAALKACAVVVERYNGGGGGGGGGGAAQRYDSGGGSGANVPGRHSGDGSPGRYAAARQETAASRLSSALQGESLFAPYPKPGGVSLHHPAQLPQELRHKRLSAGDDYVLSDVT